MHSLSLYCHLFGGDHNGCSFLRILSHNFDSGLYTFMTRTDRLNKTNQVFTPICMTPAPSEIPQCHLSRYSDLAFHLGAKADTYGCVDDIDSGTCYRHSGFGYMEGNKKEFYKYVQYISMI